VVSGPDRLLKDCRHRNIVRFEHFFWSPSVVYIVTEWCGLGDLAQFCARHRQPAQAADPAAWERTALDLLRQLAAALRFLRARDIVHMDLKPQNLLLVGRKGG
jgi:serine/threonine-protein kinase ULK/ATG1